VPQAQRLRLADEYAGDSGRQDFLHDFEQIVLALLGQLRLQLIGLVEMVHDGVLAAAGDEHQFFGAGR
jgi:hypothetical protein